MMHTRELDTRAATNKWAAARDAGMRSFAASTHYTGAERLQAERMRMAAELVYSGRVFVTFRKKFFTVKIEGARVVDAAALALLEREWALRGVSRAVTAQGTIYRQAKLA